MWWPFKKQEPMRFETPLGRFTRESKKKDEQWELLYNRDPNNRLEWITILVDDEDGVPSPDFLVRLAEIIKNLDEIEKMIRSKIIDIDDTYKLDCIWQDHDCDYIVMFNYEEEAWSQAAFIHVVNGEPVFNGFAS